MQFLRVSDKNKHNVIRYDRHQDMDVGHAVCL